MRANTNQLVILVLLVLIAGALFATDVASAQCTGAAGFVPLECFEGSRKLEDAYNTGDLGLFMNKVFVGAISIGAMLAVFRLAWAGFRYMSSDLWGTKEHAKEIIRETLLGLFLLIAIWIILYQINPQILELKIGGGDVSGSGSASFRSAQDANIFTQSDNIRAAQDIGTQNNQPAVSGPANADPFPADATKVPPVSQSPSAWCYVWGIRTLIC